MPPDSSPTLRTLSALLYALFAALGAGLLGRSALLSLAGFGLTAPTLPWRVPFGGLFVLLFLLLVLATLRLAWGLARAARIGMLERGLFLGLVGLAFLLRSLAGEPVPPEDPAVRLSESLRLVADALDAGWPRTRTYEPAPQALTEALAALGDTPYVLRGRRLPLAVLVVQGEAAPKLQPEVPAPPGTIVISLSPDRTRALVWALALDRGRAVPLRDRDGRALVLAARGGTHGLLGKDPLLPGYPGGKPFDTRP